MIHEISQLDIPDRQLLASNAPQSIWTEIGEAQVTHTIFGRAKVRIIRKNDNYHRVLWLSGMVIVAIAAAVWQGWFTSQQAEPLLSEDLPPPVSIKERANAPAVPSENIVSPAMPPAALKESSAPAQTEIDKAALVPKSAPQPAHALQTPEAKPAKPAVPQPKPVTLQQKPIAVQARPVTPQPLAGSNPQAAPLPATSAARNPAGVQAPAKSLPTKPTAAPSVATPPAARSVVQPAASSPAAVIQLSAPLMKEDIPNPAPAGDKQAPAADSVQSK
jgi:hypothetical protein